MSLNYDDRVAPALALTLIFTIVVGCAVSLIRYVEGYEQVAAARGAAIESVSEAARRVPGEGAGVLVAVPHLAGVALVTRGRKQTWGRVQGQKVAFREVKDAQLSALLSDRVGPQDLLGEDLLFARSASYQAAFEKGRASGSPATDLRSVTSLLSGPEEAFFVTDVPILVARDGATEFYGSVRAVIRFQPFSPSISVGFLGFIAFLVFLATFFLSGRTRFSPRLFALGVSALGATAAVIGQSVTTVLVSVAVTGVAVFVAWGGTADVFRGLRRQPKTYMFLAPALLCMVLMVFIPFAMGIALAFVDADGALTGLSNFEAILIPDEAQDPSFYWTLFVTLMWTAANVIMHLSIGICLALVLNRPDLRFKGIYRVLLILPWAVPSYITALLWKYMFHVEQGAVNAILGLFGESPIHWLGDSVLTNFLANLATNTWLGFPFMMVVTLGALQSIPRDLYEAADIDGASRFQSFRHITLPLLKPALVPAVILGTIWTFNMFNVIYLVSGGGPDGQTNILITQAYDSFVTSVRLGEDPGYAAAYCVLILVILLVYGWMTNRITKATEGVY